MNRKEYILELRKQLKKLPVDEYERAIEFYEDYFNDAGESNETLVIEEIGSPKDVARQVIQDTVEKYVEEPMKTVKGKWKTIKIIMLWICAAPIALPLILVLIIFSTALIATAIILVFSLVIASVTILLTGIISIIVGVYLISSQFSNALSIVGMGIMFIGLGASCNIYSLRFGKFLSNKTVQFFGYFVKRRQVNEVQ